MSFYVDIGVTLAVTLIGVALCTVMAVIAISKSEKTRKDFIYLQNKVERYKTQPTVGPNA